MSNGSGKSYCSAIKVARFLLNTPPPCPNAQYWVVSQSYEICCGVCWGQHLSQMITPDYIEDIQWYSRAKNWAQSVVMKKHTNGNNWLISFKSSDAERKRLQGFSLVGYWVDELVEFPILTEIMSRCRDFDYPGCKIWSLTPLEPAPELEKLYKERHKHPQWKFYRFNTVCNTDINEDYVSTIQATELEERRETRLTGAFPSFKGQVYKAFTPEVHVIEPFVIPSNWHKIRGMDIGFKDPTCVLWIAKDHERYYVYNEYFAAKESIEDHAAAIKSIPWEEGKEFYGPTYCDYGAAQERYEYGLRGIPSEMARKDIKSGIASVQRCLRWTDDKEGRPMLYIFNTCDNLIREMHEYSWHDHYDKPQTGNDHAVDALRYAIYSDLTSMRPWAKAELPERQIFKTNLFTNLARVSGIDE